MPAISSKISHVSGFRLATFASTQRHAAVNTNLQKRVYTTDFEIAAVPIRKERPISYLADRHRQVYTDFRCRRAFADYAELRYVPTVKEIMSNKYYERWNDFKCWQHSRLWALMKEAAQQSNPHAKFGLYSGPPSAYTRQAYGVDWEMAAKVIDIAMSEHIPRNSEFIARSYYAAMQSSGHRVPLLMSVTINGYGMGSQIQAWRRRPGLQNQLLQTIIDWDAMSLALTGVWGFDSQFNAPIRKASAVFADHENILLHGKHDDNLLSIKPKNIEYAAWLAADKTFIVAFFFNNSDDVKQVSVLNTKAFSQIITKTEVDKRNNSIHFSIPSWDCKVIKFIK